jgi:prophage regulatory protein
MPDITDEIERPGGLRALRIARVVDKTNLAQSSIYGLVAAGRFPRPFKLGGAGPTAAAAWLEHEIDAWLLERANERFLTTPVGGMMSRERAVRVKEDVAEANRTGDFTELLRKDTLQQNMRDGVQDAARSVEPGGEAA